jgi:cbb3-type cytochrome oxidase subunit 3
VTIPLDPQYWLNQLLLIVDLLSQYSLFLLVFIAAILILSFMPKRKPKVDDISSLSREDLGKKLIFTLGSLIGILLFYIAIITWFFNPESIHSIMNQFLNAN